MASDPAADEDFELDLRVIAITTEQVPMNSNWGTCTLDCSLRCPTNGGTCGCPSGYGTCTVRGTGTGC